MKNFYKMKLKVLCVILLMLALSNDSRGQLIINEVFSFMAPAGDPTKSDADGDGTRNTTNDEFIEFVNSSAAPVDISGWSLTTTSTGASPGTLQHVFPAGTIIPAGRALVLFGGPLGQTQSQFPDIFGKSIIQTADDNGDVAGGATGLSFTDGGATIRVFDVSAPTGTSTAVITFAYGTAATSTVSAGISMTRQPDVTGTLSAGSNHPVLNSRNISPGLKADGTPFYTQVSFASTADSKSEDGGSYDLIVKIQGASASVATTFDLALTSGDAADVDFQTAHVVPAGETQLTIPITIEDDALLEGNEQLTFALQNVSGGTYAASIEPSAFNLTIADNDVTNVSFAAASASIAEGAGTTYQLTLSIQSPSATLATSVDVVLTSGQALDISDYTTQTVTFPANSAANRTVTISITNDTEIETDEAITFTLQNASQPGGTASVGAGNTFTLTITNDDAVSPLVINEFCAFPSASGSGVDANGDGSTNGNTDEYIELVNSGADDLDISQWTIFGGAGTPSLRYTFGNDVVLQPGEAIVVFGAWNTTAIPQEPSHIGGSRVFFTDASAGATASLGMSNTGATLQVKSAAGVTQREYTFPGTEAVNSVSYVLSPEITGTAYIAHPALGGKTISPGKKADGTDFIEVVTTLVVFTAASATADEGTDTYTLELSIENPHATQATSLKVALTSGDGTQLGNYQTTTVSFPGGSSASQTIPVTIPEDIAADLSFTFSIQDVTGGDNAAAGIQNTFSLTVKNTNPPLIINEIHGSPATITPPADGHGDANGDGTRNATSDEFIEFVNVSGAALDVSGWVVRTGSAQLIRHTFPASTVIPKDGALALFGGPGPTGSFGGSMVQVCNATDVTNVSAAVTSSNGLIANGGTTVNVDNQLGADMITYQTPNVGSTITASLTRNPDITGTLDINAVHPLLGNSYFSPGTKVNGDPFIVVTTTQVAFTSVSTTISEKDGTYQLQIGITNPDPATATSADVVLAQGDAAAINGFQSATVNFAGATPGNQSVTITITNNEEAESNKVFIFELRNVQGGSNATAGTASTFTLTVVDDDVVPGQLVVINEIHPRLELAPNGDTNGDGTRSTTNDEFIEFMNITTGELDISGWKVMTGSGTGTLQHVFPEATVIPAGGAVLLFGGPDPDEGAFGGSVVQVADDGTGAIGLSLTDQSAMVRLLDADGVLQDEVTYFSESSSFAGISISRSPDGGALTFDGQQRALPNHPTVMLEDGRQHQYSPGIKSDGTPFIEITNTTVQFVTVAGGRYEHDTAPSPVAVTIALAHATQPTTFDIALDTPDPDGELSFSPTSFTFTPGEPETQYINISIHDDALLEGDEVFTFRITNVSGGDHASPGKNKTFAFRIYDNDMPVIFNEVHAAPAADIAGDANHDGARSASEDEFVELVNVTDETIDMGGWKLYSGSDVLRHVFLPGTKLEPRKALVVFGGGIPLGFFGGSKFQLSSEGGLGLTDNGTALVLKNKADELQSSFTYGTDGNIKQSLTRSPDITGYYVPHSEAENANGILFSPGMKADSWPFGDLTTGVSTEETPGVSFYPNPARSSATLITAQHHQTFDYMIADMTGRPVIQAREITGKAIIALGGLSEGLYFYTVRAADNGKTLGKGTFIVIH